MQSGADQFKDWMRRRGFNQADAARYLEFDKPYVSVLATGTRTPGLDNAIKLERLTGIPVEAWLSQDNEPEQTVSANTPELPDSQGDNR
jgi:plasmid maintenance system antidote protein VapI